MPITLLTSALAAYARVYWKGALILSQIPTERYTVRDPDHANEEITAYLKGLAADGKEPCCEVRYPAPAHVDAAEWLARQEQAFDAIELVDGELRTLPPYAVMEVN